MIGLKISPRWQACLICAFLVALFWLVRYRYSGHFGLYEDDLTIIPQAVQMSFGKLIQFIAAYIINFQGQSRPLHHSFIYFFSWVGWRVAGMAGLYIIGFAIESLNICLLFTLVARLSNLRLAALVTLAYVLYSADTTQAYLTLSLGVHPSITLLLLSLHCYISKRRVLSYLLAFIILFGYETPFPLFFAAPLLLAGSWNKRMWTRMLVHCLIVSTMLIGVILFRNAMGDQRVGVSSLSELISTALNNVMYGPYMNVVAYGTRVVDTLKSLNILGVVIFTFGGLLLVTGFLIFIPDDKADYSVKHASLSEIFLAENWSMARLALAGLAMLVLGYTMIFTTPPTYLYGRITRAHLSSGIGAAFVYGIAAFWLLERFKKIRARLAGIVMVAVICAPLIGFGFLLQVDYIHAWQSQQRFWTKLVPLISDAGLGDVVLVEPGIFITSATYDTTYIDANTWNVPRLLSQLYDYPFSTANLPHVYRLTIGWEKSILMAGGRLNLDEATVFAPPSLYQEVSPAHVIFIQNNSGDMQRVSVVAGINGQTIQVKPFDQETAISYPESYFYKYMILSNP